MKKLAAVLISIAITSNACRSNETSSKDGVVINLAQFEVIDAAGKPSDVDNEMLFTLKMISGNPIKKSALTVFIKKDDGSFTSVQQQLNDANNNAMMDIGETIELRDVKGYNAIPMEYADKETSVEVLEQREGQPYLQLWSGFWTP